MQPAVLAARTRRAAAALNAQLGWKGELASQVRVVPDFPGATAWKRLLAVAAAREDEVRRLVLSAFAAVEARATGPAFERALQAGRPDDVVDYLFGSGTLEDGLMKVVRSLDDVFLAGAQVAGDQLREDLGLPVVVTTGPGEKGAKTTHGDGPRRRVSRRPVDVELHLNLTNPRAIRAAEQNAGRFIVQATAASRQAIRDLTARSLREGIPVGPLGRMIRQHIGLSPQQYRTSNNYFDALQRVQRGEMTAAELNQRFTLGRGAPANVTVDNFAQVWKRYTDAMRAARATVIARQEPLEAMRAGQHALWEEAGAEGLLPADEFEREWIAVVPSDGKTCALCIARAGTRAPLPDGPYPTGEPRPGAHIQCRCAERIVEREDLPDLPAEAPPPEVQTPLDEAREIVGTPDENDKMMEAFEQDKWKHREAANAVGERLADHPDLQKWYLDRPTLAGFYEDRMDVAMGRGVQNWRTLAFNDPAAFWRDHLANNRAARGVVASNAARQMVETWNGTSADHNRMALAMQRAARDEFNLTAAYTKHLPDLTGAKDLYQEHGRFIRGVLRAQHDLTQEWFARQGIKEVTLYRGMRDLTVPHRVALENVSLQPMSSFAVRAEVASGFTSTHNGSMLAVRVPARDVLSMPFTGNGVGHEYEAVVLGRSQRALHFNWGHLRHSDTYSHYLQEARSANRSSPLASVFRPYIDAWRTELR